MIVLQVVKRQKIIHIKRDENDTIIEICIIFLIALANSSLSGINNNC